ncbi:CheF family chemotaxis protein [Halalkalirubrum salinum]|uniref:CheF family chemotaxis protein n=1 Tax=Halalkalirubrum salinum TaxID=2563889 RepID=UPI0010FB65B9|nr:CheF family chemotaxis protein [Halalkalirubrum salinum]
MSEGIVADFVGQFHTASIAGPEPVTGRILLSKQRLVLAHDGGKTTIPLSAISDINVGTVPPSMREFFSDTISLAYSIDDDREIAVIESGGTNVERFKTVLFKTLLEGQTVKIKHPAKVGGRVTNADVHNARLALASGVLRFRGRAGGFSIDLSNVTDFARETRELAGTDRPTIAVTHMDGRTAKTTLVTLPNARKLNLLARYLRLEYESVMKDAAELSVAPEETEILVSIYSAGGNVALNDLVTGDVASMQVVLDALREKGLIADQGSGLVLTPKGQVVVTERVESVNT